MLEIFRKNHFGNNIFLLLYTALFRFASFLDPGTWIAPQKGYGSAWIYSWIGSSSLSADILALILVFVQAVLINHISSQHRLTRENSMFPGIVYVLMISFFPEYQYLSPIILANTFVLIGLSDVFHCYQKGDSASFVFNAGLMLGIASFFYFPYTYLLLAFYIGFIILKSFGLRDILQFLIGFVLPHFLVGVWAYWKDVLPDYVQYQWVQPFGFIWVNQVESWQLYFRLMFMMLLVAVSVFYYGPLTAKTFIHVKKKVDVCYWLLLIGGIGTFFQSQSSISDLQIIVIPLAIFMGSLLLQVRNKLIAEIIHLAIIAAVLSLQYLF